MALLDAARMSLTCKIPLGWFPEAFQLALNVCFMIAVCSLRAMLRATRYTFESWDPGKTPLVHPG